MGTVRRRSGPIIRNWHRQFVGHHNRIQYFELGGTVMTKKIAVAIIHGIGSQTDDFAKEMEEALKQQFAKSLKKMNISIADPTSQLVIKPICWSEIFEDPERKLWAKFRTRDLDYIGLRESMIRVFADAIAYQKSPSQKLL